MIWLPWRARSRSTRSASGPSATLATWVVRTLLPRARSTWRRASSCWRVQPASVTGVTYIQAARVGVEEAAGVWATTPCAADKAKAASKVAARFLYMVFLYMAPEKKSAAGWSTAGAAGEIVLPAPAARGLLCGLATPAVFSSTGDANKNACTRQAFAVGNRGPSFLDCACDTPAIAGQATADYGRRSIPVRFSPFSGYPAPGPRPPSRRS